MNGVLDCLYNIININHKFGDKLFSWQRFLYSAAEGVYFLQFISWKRTENKIIDKSVQ